MSWLAAISLPGVRVRWLLGLYLGAAVAGGGGRAEAQSAGVDPYDPWTYQYRASIYPGASGLSALPNQARVRNLPNDTSMFDMGDPFASSSRPGGRFVPYYMRNFREPAVRDRINNATPEGRSRTYVANANDRFYDRQAERDQKFFEALRERDPQRRAQLLRQVDEASRSAVLSAQDPRARAAEAAAATARSRGAGRLNPNRRPGGPEAARRPANSLLDDAEALEGEEKAAGLDPMSLDDAEVPGNRRILPRFDQSNPVLMPSLDDEPQPSLDGSDQPGLDDEMGPGEPGSIDEEDLDLGGLPGLDPEDEP